MYFLYLLAASRSHSAQKHGIGIMLYITYHISKPLIWKEKAPVQGAHIPSKTHKNANNQHLYGHNGKLPKFVNNSLCSYNRKKNERGAKCQTI
jgi:hypothetical protein